MLGTTRGIDPLLHIPTLVRITGIALVRTKRDVLSLPLFRLVIRTVTLLWEIVNCQSDCPTLALKEKAYILHLIHRTLTRLKSNASVASHSLIVPPHDQDEEPKGDEKISYAEVIKILPPNICPSSKEDKGAKDSLIRGFVTILASFWKKYIWHFQKEFLICFVKKKIS